MVRAFGPPPLASLRPQSPYSGVHHRVSDIFVVRCNFIYPCWTCTACCNLLTWAERKWVRQLTIQGAIISSINMVITGISMGIGQLQIPPCQEKIPQREIVATWRTVQLILWDPIGSECFLEDCNTFFNLTGGIYWETTSHSRSIKSLLVQGSGDLFPIYFGVQPLPSCVGSLELSWEILSPES